MMNGDRPPDRWQVENDQDSPADDRPVGGFMAAYVGHRYPVDELLALYRDHADVHPEEEPTLRPRAARIRAFDVPTLSGAVVHFDRLSVAPERLQELLEERLPGATWHVGRVSGLAKYGIVHTIVPAPKDESTGQTMVIELFGHAIGADHYPLPRTWFDPFRAAWRLAEQSGTPEPVVGALGLRIERATYANTFIPGIGVPFYL